MIGFGVVATFFALGDARDNARDNDLRAARLAAAQLSGSLESTVAAVRGADSLVVDGQVDTEEFAAFANGVIRDSLYTALAYAQVVDFGQRADFLSRTGIEFRDTDGAGGFVSAPPRQRSIVVVQVYPRTATTNEIIGFDLAGEPVRRRAAAIAESSETPVLSDRTTTASEAVAGFSVISAVRASDGTVVGFVTSGIPVDDVVARAGVRLAEREFGLWMDGQLLTSGAPEAGATSTFTVAGRTFELRADSGQGVSLLLPTLMALGTVALAVAVGVAARREHRQQRRLARLADHNRGIAELAQVLSSSNDEASLMTDIGSRIGVILDDALVVVARRAPDDPAAVLVDVASPALSESGRDWLLRGPVSTTIDTGIPSSIARLDDHLVALGSVVSVPLRFSGGFTFGALVFAWRESMPSTELDERSLAATTIGELASAALERATVAKVVRTGAERLSVFAQSLAAAHTSDDVRAAVRELVPGVLGAASADLVVDVDGEGDRGAANGVVRHVILDSDADPVGVLEVRWRRADAIGTTQHAVIITLADLIEQTLKRTARAQQEHDVIVQLQRDLLSTPAAIGGLDVAVSYQPALSVVGLGGDFYDLIVSDQGRVFAVIGDIAGHGSRAVAAMSELKSVVQHLLRSGASIEVVCAHADLLLARRDMLATAQICEIDLDQQVVRYVNAGHPYPIVKRADGEVILLRSGHRRLLGLVGDVRTEVASTPFAVGDVLLLYTDGLIERRSEPIDDAIDALARTVADAETVTMQLFVSDLEAHLVNSGERSDDDIAVLAVRRSDSSPPESTASC